MKGYLERMNGMVVPGCGKGVMAWMVRVGVMLMVVVSMSAEAGLFSHTMEWKEEVKLNDGRVMVVERHYNLGGYPTLDAHERTPLDQTITFILPDTNQKISWKTKYQNDVPELNSLSALLLDVVGGIPYLATTPAGCIAYNKWGRPNPPYVLYKYANNEWQRIPLEEFPAVLVHANLMGRPASSLLKPYYTVEAAKAVREDGNVDAYVKTILRGAIQNLWSSCPALIRTADGWKSRDWFEDQPSREECLKFCNRENVSAENCPCISIFKEKK